MTHISSREFEGWVHLFRVPLWCCLPQPDPMPHSLSVVVTSAGQRRGWSLVCLLFRTGIQLCYQPVFSQRLSTAVVVTISRPLSHPAAAAFSPLPPPPPPPPPPPFLFLASKMHPVLFHSDTRHHALVRAAAASSSNTTCSRSEVGSRRLPPPPPPPFSSASNSSTPQPAPAA